MQLKKILISAALFLSLSACHNEPMNHDYLMLHPDVLQKEFAKCEQLDNQPFCDLVRQTARDFMVLVDERGNDPEKFGQKIMDVQTQLIQMKAQHAPEDKIKDLQLQLKELYAVVAATSDE